MFCAEILSDIVFPRPRRHRTGPFSWAPRRRLRSEERPMLTQDCDTRSEDPPPTAARARPAGLTIRASEPTDWQELAALIQLPRVRWGTLRLPFVSADETRKWLEKPSEGRVQIVAMLDGKIVGTAGLTRDKGRRSHVGS